MYMNEEASVFYLSRTLPFLSIAGIAKKLGVTRPTVERMVDNWKIPMKYHSSFESILDGLSNEFRLLAKKAPQPNFYSQLEKSMLDVEPKNIVGKAHLGMGDDDAFIREITPLLERRRGVSSKEVLDIGFKHRVTRQKVYRLTDIMGVRRNITGAGRAMSSTWYLD